MKKITLNQIRMDREVYVQKINCTGSIKRRLMDLGLTEGTKVKPLFQSPLGDPTAYEIRGAVISLREDDTKNIAVSIE